MVMRPVWSGAPVPICNGEPTALSVAWLSESVPAPVPTPIVVAGVSPKSTAMPLPVIDGAPPASAESEMLSAMKAASAELSVSAIVAPCDWLMLPVLAVKAAVSAMVTLAVAAKAMLSAVSDGAARIEVRWCRRRGRS